MNTGAPARKPQRVIPIATAPAGDAAAAAAMQRRRRAFQAGFFALFVLAPVFDLFRYDLDADHAWLLGMEWRLGLDPFLAGQASALEAAGSIILNLFVPLLALAALVIGAAWKWGRLYCGWLCPHFSVVESINRLMARASGKASVWDRHLLPAWKPDGRPARVDARWWGVVVPAAVGFAFLWAVVLLTYLLPPAEVYGRLWHLDPTRNQTLFLSVATGVLTLEFLFARHLFCRFGCAVGLFQSLAWMSNRGAMVIGYARPRAADCAACYDAGGPGYAACEGVCPMRLRPRTPKHKMFACTQCAQCVQACGTVQQAHGKVSLLKWVDRDAARSNEAQVSLTGNRD